MAPNLGDAWQLRGLVYEAKNKLGAAILELDKAIELQPDASIHYQVRSRLNRKLKRIEAAMKDINQALVLNSDNPPIYW